MTTRQQYKSIYWAWKSMKQRCLNKDCSSFYNYGGRGIKICADWMAFEPFCEWALMNGWKKGLDLDRLDNNGNYCPENCRWIDRRTNVNNRRVTVFLTVDGVKKPSTEWETISGVPRATIKRWRLNHGVKYAESRIYQAIKKGYKEKDYSYLHKRKVKHIETGYVFDSLMDAGKYFGLAGCTISNSIRNNKATGKGKFEYMEGC